jgi:hypothetical protein
MMAPVRRFDDVAEVKAALVRLGPGPLLEAIGIRYRYEGAWCFFSCPWHDENTPSAVLRVGDEGTLQVRCHGACKRSWDALALVAQACGLDPKRDFRAVLAECARIAGLHALVAELDTDKSGAPRGERSRVVLPPLAAQERSYPPLDEVKALWESAKPFVNDEQIGALDYRTVITDPEAYAVLCERGIPPERVTDLDLARVLPVGASVPRWASKRGPERSTPAPWPSIEYRVILPVFDSAGVMRSVRAWRIGPRLAEGDEKRLPPGGYRAKGLILACPLGRQMLAVGAEPSEWPAHEPFRVVVAEGEPDFLTWATRFSDANATAPALLAVVAGAWTEEIASRVPDGARVIIRTHRDASGGQYAEQIKASSVGRRCDVRDLERAAGVTS